MIKRLIRKLSSVIKVDTVFDKDPNIESLSTLQKVEFSGQEEDVFYLQTRIRICAHIAEKDLTSPVDKPRYRQFARELGERLHDYQGPNITSIEWANSILQMYEHRYGL